MKCNLERELFTFAASLNTPGPLTNVNDRVEAKAEDLPGVADGGDNAAGLQVPDPEPHRFLYC